MASVHPVTTPTKTGPTRTWQVRWRTPDGKQHKRHFKKKGDADKWATGRQAAKDRGEHGDPQKARTKLATYIEDTWWPTKINLKPKTADSYRGILKWEILPTFGTTSLARIQSTHIEQWLIDMNQAGKSASRIRQAKSLLHQILGHAARHDILPRNPATGIPTPTSSRQERQLRYITPTEIDRLADNVPDRYHALILLLGFTGIRWAEAVGLQRRHVGLQRITIETTLSEVNGHFYRVPPKTRSATRTVHLPVSIATDLAQHIDTYTEPEPDDLIFTSEGGGPIRAPNFRRRVWQPACEATGIDLTPHELRHSAASMMIDNGHPLDAVSKTLGHSSIAVTVDRYSHLYTDTAEELAARLDDLRAGNKLTAKKTSGTQGALHP
jgi:integrase